MIELITVPVAEPKLEKNRLHLDLVSESGTHQTEMVARLTDLGASPYSGATPTEDFGFSGHFSETSR